MDHLGRNWKAKLGSLVVGALVWWLIKAQVTEPRRTIEDLALPPQDVREL